MDRIVLGKRYEDITTGFRGTATARAEYLKGDAQVLLEPGLHEFEQSATEPRWFDERRLEEA